MKKENNISEPKKVEPMSDETKKRLAEVAEKIKGREFFLRKKAWAKDILKDVKTLPI